MLNQVALKDLYKKLITEPNQTYDRIICHIYSHLLEPGDIAVDVGANTGLHTVPMARKVVPHGRILAFEPVPENLQQLKKRLKNQQLLSNVSLYGVALSNFTGKADFRVFMNSPGLSCFKERENYDKAGMEVRKVQVDQLDNRVPGEMRVKFLKIDVEGADLNVMQGGTAIIKRDRPVIVLESGRIKAVPAGLYNYSQEEFLGFFADLGYVLYDPLGLPFYPGLWDVPTLNDFVAVPEERREEIVELIWFSALEVLSEKFGELPESAE